MATLYGPPRLKTYTTSRGITQRDCPNGQCVIEALKTQLALLQSRATDQERLKAMKWVIHLVGDIHQPL